MEIHRTYRHMRLEYMAMAVADREMAVRAAATPERSTPIAMFPVQPAALAPRRAPRRNAAELTTSAEIMLPA